MLPLAAAVLIALPADAGQRQLGALQGTVSDQTGGSCQVPPSR
jgi:hypothetical protein